MKSYYKIFQALSDETRLRIYSLLLHGELCVCELKTILKMEQSRISHGLRILKEADLVVSSRVGKWKIYSINKKILIIFTLLHHILHHLLHVWT